VAAPAGDELRSTVDDAYTEALPRTAMATATSVRAFVIFNSFRTIRDRRSLPRGRREIPGDVFGVMLRAAQGG
jgi:hypothetical protein